MGGVAQLPTRNCLPRYFLCNFCQDPTLYLRLFLSTPLNNTPETNLYQQVFLWDSDIIVGVANGGYTPKKIERVDRADFWGCGCFFVDLLGLSGWISKVMVICPSDPADSRR